MMYMEDAIKAVLMLMEADAEHIKTRSSYTPGVMSFAQNVAQHHFKPRPDFKSIMQPDCQSIADSWPESIEMITK